MVGCILLFALLVNVFNSSAGLLIFPINLYDAAVLQIKPVQQSNIFRYFTDAKYIRISKYIHVQYFIHNNL